MPVPQHGMPPYPRDGGEETSAVPTRDALSVMLTALGLLLVVAAMLVASYPFVSSTWGAYRAERQFSEEHEVASLYDGEAVDSLVSQAERYNDALAGIAQGEGVPLYDEQLLYEGADALCWLDIPSLGIKLPVFRDDGSEEVPSEGAEHMRGTSLPVGGTSSNTVITAHSGSHAGTPMAFNKLDYLKPGDVIIMWTLGRPYAYEVDGSEQVDPSDTSKLRIIKGEDRLTLLTCRPIGTTSKRLFVYAHRVGYAAEEGRPSRVEALAAPGLPQLVLGFGASGLALWLLLLFAWRTRPRWYLNRAIGEFGCSEHDVARFAEDGAQDMALELRRRGKARLRLFGGEVEGSWKRQAGCRSRIELDFSAGKGGGVALECAASCAACGISEIRLPDGPFVAESLDGELAFDAVRPATKLVFSPRKPQSRAMRHGRWGRVRR